MGRRARSSAPFRLAFTAALASTVTLASPGRAESDAATEPAASESGAPTLHGSLRLSLADAIAMGLENNLDVEIQRFSPLIAEESYRSSWGAYDPRATGEIGRSESSLPAGNALSGVPFDKRDVTDGSAGVAGLLPFLNATYAIDYAASDTTVNAIFASNSPQYDSGLTFSGSVPLLKNLVWNQAWTNVRVSQERLGAAQEDFRKSVMDTTQGIEAAYWTLVARAEQERVAAKSFDTARALLEQVETQYEVGVVSRVEVVEAEAGVAEREVAFIEAENAHRAAQDELIDRVLGPHLTAVSMLHVEPTDSPDAFVAYEVDVANAVDRAFENRPEIQSAEHEVELREVQLRFARNQRLPQLDVQGSYGVTGLRGAGNTIPNLREDPLVIGDETITIPPTGSGVGDANDDFFGSRGGDQWTVRGVLSFPLGNVSGRHDASRAALELRRASTQLRRLRQSIILEVRNGARDLLSAQQRIEAAERRRAAAAEQLRAERVRLEHGESTPFEVLQRERDLVDAESQKISALQQYHTSEASLLRAQGTILEARNVVIDDVRELR